MSPVVSALSDSLVSRWWLFTPRPELHREFVRKASTSINLLIARLEPRHATPHDPAETSDWRRHPGFFFTVSTMFLTARFESLLVPLESCQWKTDESSPMATAHCPPLLCRTAQRLQTTFNSSPQIGSSSVYLFRPRLSLGWACAGCLSAG